MRVLAAACSVLVLFALPSGTMAIGSSSQAPMSVEYTAKSTRLDPASYPAPPEGLELEQVNVFVRHGGSLCYGFPSSLGVTARNLD